MFTHTLHLATALLSLPFTLLHCLSVATSDSDWPKHRLLSTALGEGNAGRPPCSTAGHLPAIRFLSHVWPGHPTGAAGFMGVQPAPPRHRASPLSDRRVADTSSGLATSLMQSIQGCNQQGCMHVRASTEMVRLRGVLLLGETQPKLCGCSRRRA